MSKRSAGDIVSSTHTNTSEAFKKAPGGGQKRPIAEEDEHGEYEDAWEDELESDEEVIDAGEDEENAMQVDEVLEAVDEEEQQTTPSAYIPGAYALGEDEVLEADDSVYIMRHTMNVNWPCLSFDILRDDLGDERRRFPATAHFVAGTQADVAKKNELVVYKLSSLHRTQNDANDSEDSDNEDEDEDALDEDPVLEHRSIPHSGAVNRVRAQPIPASSTTMSHPYHVATWAETGKVHIWDVKPLIDSLNVPGYTPDKSRTQKPIFTINSHGHAEGFAMDWAASGESSPSSLRLLTGDIHSKIYLTTSTPSGFNTLQQPFVSHTSSVEDLQWSPSEPTIFSSCSADRTVQIWDVRIRGRRSVAGIDPAHAADVNVISWNRHTEYLLLSGGDEGGIKVWDLRNIKKRGEATENPSPVASFNWHQAPITSIEWHPTEDSTFVASGSDDQVTLWDLGVEEDVEETGTIMRGIAEGERSVPPQLLFVHQGQRDVKEVHWHPQIPGTVLSTALDGFNIFKTISV